MRSRRYTLDAWLASATRGLCAEAKERIRDEIEAHVSEALSTMARDGVPAGERYAVALRQLGSPRAARRAYRRQWLTTWEARTFDSFERSVDSTRKQFGGLRLREWMQLVLFAFMVTQALQMFDIDERGLILGPFFVGFAFTFLAAPVSRIVSKRFGKRWAFPTFAGCQTMYMLGNVVLMAGVPLMFYGDGLVGTLFVFFTAVMFGICMQRAKRNANIWRKMYVCDKPNGHA